MGAAAGVVMTHTVEATGVVMTHMVEVGEGTSTAAVLRTSTAAVLKTSTAAVLRTSTAAVLKTNTAAVLRTNTAAVLRTNTAAVLKTNTAAVLRTNTAAVLKTNTAAVLKISTAAVVVMIMIESALGTIMTVVVTIHPSAAGIEGEGDLHKMSPGLWILVSVPSFQPNLQPKCFNFLFAVCLVSFLDL